MSISKNGLYHLCVVKFEMIKFSRYFRDVLPPGLAWWCHDHHGSIKFLDTPHLPVAAEHLQKNIETLR